MASSSGQFSSADDNEALIMPTEAELLKRAWRNEKAAPEILQFEEELVKRAKEQIQLMEDTVEEYAESGFEPLSLSLFQMDIDRTQFLLRSYLRARLLKIEKFMFYIVKFEEAEKRLSEQEKIFAKRCVHDMGKHLEESVLLKLPDNYQSVVKQSVISEEDDMGLLYNRLSSENKSKNCWVTFLFGLPQVPEPQLDIFVISKTKSFVTLDLHEDGENPKTVEMEQGDIYFIQYKNIKEALESGKIDLI